MQRRHAVDLVRHHKSQFAHPHFVVLDDADVMRWRKRAPMPAVDAFNDLHMARQHCAKSKGCPAFQCFGQQGVVGIAKTIARSFQRIFKAQAVFIGQKADQFRPGNRGVRVIHLDGRVFRQIQQVGMIGFETAHDVLQGGRGQEKLLFQPQFFTLIGGVIGIKNAGQGARQIFRFCGGCVVAPVEPFQIEHPCWLGLPKAQRIGPFALPPDHRRIMCRSKNSFAGHPNVASIPVFDLALERNGITGFRAPEFPRMGLV